MPTQPLDTTPDQWGLPEGIYDSFAGILPTLKFPLDETRELLGRMTQDACALNAHSLSHLDEHGLDEEDVNKEANRALGLLQLLDTKARERKLSDSRASLDLDTTYKISLLRDEHLKALQSDMTCEDLSVGNLRGSPFVQLALGESPIPEQWVHPALVLDEAALQTVVDMTIDQLREQGPSTLNEGMIPTSKLASLRRRFFQAVHEAPDQA